MKQRLLIFIAFITVANLGVYSQCVINGLSSVYCQSDASDTLTASCNGSPVSIFGAGVNSQGVFNPSNAGSGIHVLSVFPDPNAYIIDTSGTFDPDTGSGTSVALSDDDVSGPLPIGFGFRFFDNSYTSFRISSNGFIFFGSGSDNGCCSGELIPGTATPNNLIAFAWEDLDPDGVGTIEYYTIGTAPDRRLIMNFIDVPHFPGPGPTNNITSQVQLWEGCGRIEIHTTTQPDGFSTHTMGIENSTGTVAYAPTGRNSSTWTATDDYVAFVPVDCYSDTVVVNPGPSLSITADSLDCASDSNGTANIMASGNGPFTYAWSNGQTTPMASGLHVGTHHCTITDNNGCASFANVEIGSPLPLGATFDVTGTVGESDDDGTIVTPVSGGVEPYGYEWDDPGSSTTADLNGLEPGTYLLTVTDLNGCEFVTSATVGFEHEDPEVDLGDDKGFCPGQSAVLVGPPGMVEYNWSSGDSVISAIVNTAGIYSLTVTDNEGCTNSDDVTVTVFLPVQVDLGPDQSGPGPIVLDAGSVFTNYLWSTGANGQIVNVTLPGDYSVTVTDTNGCATSDTVTVSIWASGVEDVDEVQLTLFPNPASDRVFVRSSAPLNNVRMTLFDLSGREIFAHRVDMQAGRDLPVDLGSLPAGTYFIRLRADTVLRDFKVTLK